MKFTLSKPIFVSGLILHWSRQLLGASSAAYNRHWLRCRFSKELFTSCVRSCTSFTTDKYHSTCQTVYSQFLQPVTDTGWGRLAQRATFCVEQEPDLENVVSSTPVRPLGTLVLPTFSDNDSRVYFLIVLTTDYCWRSWTCRIAASYK